MGLVDCMVDACLSRPRSIRSLLDQQGADDFANTGFAQVSPLPLE